MVGPNTQKFENIVFQFFVKIVGEMSFHDFFSSGFFHETTRHEKLDVVGEVQCDVIRWEQFKKLTLFERLHLLK